MNDLRTGQRPDRDQAQDVGNAARADLLHGREEDGYGLVLATEQLEGVRP